MSCRCRSRGQSLIETLVGIIILVPIVLFLFDVGVLVLANSANDNLAKHCARAAASATNASGQGDGNAALTAARQVARNFTTSTIIKAPGGSDDGEQFVTGFSWNGGTAGTVSNGTLNAGAPGQGQVAVETTMLVRTPVPFPFFGGANFTARAVEPIVSIPPQ